MTHLKNGVTKEPDPETFQSNVAQGLNPIPPYDPVIMPSVKFCGAIQVIQLKRRSAWNKKSGIQK